MHGIVVIDGMAHRETGELGQEGVEVGTKERIARVCTPIHNVMGFACVIVQRRGHFLLLPESILRGQYLHGLAELASKSL